MTLSQNIPLLRDTSPAIAGHGINYSTSIGLMLILVIGAVALVLWRHRGKTQGTTDNNLSSPRSWTRWLIGNQMGSVKLIHSTHLGSKCSLHDVEWQGKRLLIGCSSQSIRLLAETPSAGDTGTDGAT